MFPMSAAALATMACASGSRGVFAKVPLAVGLSFLSSVTAMFVEVFTVARSFSGELFPNDEVVGGCLTPNPPVRNEASHLSNPFAADARCQSR